MNKKTLRSSVTGHAAITHDIYHIWNMGNTLHRYVEGSLQQIGPELNEGLPEDRQGVYRRLVSYAGRFFLGIRGASTQYSSVMSYNGGGWHEVWRGVQGEPLYDVAVQVVDGGDRDRLWISAGKGWFYLPLPKGSFDPLEDSGYPYRHEGHLITSWISGGLLFQKKLWHHLRLYTQDLSANDNIRVFYQLETGQSIAKAETTWTALADNVFDSSEIQTKEIETTADTPNISGRRIRFMLVFNTTDKNTTPVLYAWLLYYLAKYSVRYAYTFQYELSDNPLNLQTGQEQTARAQDIQTTLDNWHRQLIPVKVSFLYSLYHGAEDSTGGLEGMVHSVGTKPVMLDIEGESEPIEVMMGECTIVEI